MDRTLVRKNTASLYMRYQRDRGEARIADQLRLAWWLFQYSLGVIDAPRVAEVALRGYRGRAEQEVIDMSQGWFEKYVREHVCDAGRQAVMEHKARGEVTAIVTGATRYAAQPLASELGIDHVVSTLLQVESGCFTGKVDQLCYGANKIELARRIAEHEGFELEDATFYSDSITDLPLLERVREPVVVNPDGRLRRVALRRRWRIERW